MAGIPVLGGTGITLKAGKTQGQLTKEMANRMAQNSAILRTGQETNASRNSAASVAATAQALANQTGGNIMGFTYE